MYIFLSGTTKEKEIVPSIVSRKQKTVALLPERTGLRTQARLAQGRVRFVMGSRKEKVFSKTIIIHTIPRNHRKRHGGKTSKRSVHKGKNNVGARAPTHRSFNALDDLKTHVPLFPASARKRLMYYEPSFTLTGTAGAITQYVFTANGLYDPNITGSGHQPLGFDTMMLYYEQYTVVRSSLTLRFVGNGTQACTVSVCLAPDTTSLVLPDVMENGYIVSKVVDARGNGGYGTGQRVNSHALSCDVVKYFGRKSQREILDDVNLYGTAAANPTEQVYFVINTWGFGSFTDNTSIAMDAVLEYDAIFWEPRKVAAQLASNFEHVPEQKAQGPQPSAKQLAKQR